MFGEGAGEEAIFCQVFEYGHTLFEEVFEAIFITHFVPEEPVFLHPTVLAYRQHKIKVPHNLLYTLPQNVRILSIFDKERERDLLILLILSISSFSGSIACDIRRGFCGFFR